MKTNHVHALNGAATAYANFLRQSIDTRMVELEQLRAHLAAVVDIAESDEIESENERQGGGVDGRNTKPSQEDLAATTKAALDEAIGEKPPASFGTADRKVNNEGRPIVETLVPRAAKA